MTKSLHSWSLLKDSCWVQSNVSYNIAE